MFDFFKKKPIVANTLDANKPDNVLIDDNVATDNTIIEPATSLTIANEDAILQASTTNVTTQLADNQSTETGKPSITERLKKGLAKTRNLLGGQLNALFGSGKIDDETYDELETILITSDIGAAATHTLLENLKTRVKRENLSENSELKAALKTELLAVLKPLEIKLNTENHLPFVIMMVGVNGAGKTTTIGKLAKRFQAEGNTVLIAAGDTFRAAAREQLQVWGARNGVQVISSEGGDPAAVIFDAVNSAIAKKIDIVIADTAGRLPTQNNLMDEIKKVQRVINKAYPGAPHEILLVIDANTGQNAVSQVKAFNDALGVTGLVLSKLDGTAKGGVIAAIAHLTNERQSTIPIRYVGIGEAIDDLRPFSAQAFVDAMID